MPKGMELDPRNNQTTILLHRLVEYPLYPAKKKIQNVWKSRAKLYWAEAKLIFILGCQLLKEICLYSNSVLLIKISTLRISNCQQLAVISFHFDKNQICGSAQTQLHKCKLRKNYLCMSHSKTGGEIRL